MKILLLTHPLTVTKGTEDNFGMFPPLGLAYVASMLEKHGHDVDIIDVFAEGFKVHEEQHNGDIRIGLRKDDILLKVKESNPDVVGISNNFTSFSNDAIGLAKLIKESFPHIFLIMGGANVTAEFTEIVKLPYVDAVVCGEGEFVLVEVVERLKLSRSLEGIRGVVWKRHDSSIAVNEVRAPIENLDELPFPAFHLLNMELYLRQKSHNFAYSKRFPIGHMITSRGCLYNCIFCSTSKYFKKFRVRSPQNVLDEIEFLTTKYRVKEIHFHDDSALADPQRFYRICMGILDRNIDISWQVGQGVTVTKLKPEMLSVMQKSGMYRIGLPIESGSKNTLKFIRKPINLERAVQVINECNRLGIYTFGCFIIGFPDETREDIEDTVTFILKSNLDFIKLAIYQPLAGSDLYKIYKEKGALKNSRSNASAYEKTKYDTTFFTADELNTLRQKILREFFKCKIKAVFKLHGFINLIYPKLNSPDKLAYFLRLVFISVRRLLLGKPVFGI